MPVSSLFIPHAALTDVETSFVEVFIAIVFEQGKIANVGRVDVIRNKTSPRWYSAFVYIDQWYQTSQGETIHGNINADRKCLFYYTANEYWALLQNTSRHAISSRRIEWHENMANAMPPPPPLKRSVNISNKN
jgi:hypothetical protein